jgi:Tfp pilus assembly protein PilF
MATTARRGRADAPRDDAVCGARPWRSLAIVFATALVVRGVYLYESSDCPTAAIPIVDARAYDELARALAAGQPMNEKFFWQAYFYPYFLFLVYSLTQASVWAARICQVVLGAVTCILTYRLGARVYDARTGLVAGLAAAFYGPLIFFEAELVAAGWAAFWSVALVLLFLRAVRTRTAWSSVLLGVSCILAILTRPDALLFTGAAGLWLAWRLARPEPRPPGPLARPEPRPPGGANRDWRPLLRLGGAIVVGGAVFALPVAWQSWQITGRFTILPSSGGINFYIGNHPDSTRLVLLRPGEEWDELAQRPLQHGITGMWPQQQYFYQQTRTYIAAQPLDFLHGLGRKTVQFFSAREIPRNEDIYVYRRWSAVLSVLVWKLGGFGFPAGLVLPLAAVGLVGTWRRLPAPLLLQLIFLPVAVVLVFVSARYRVPLVPLLCVLAAGGVQEIVQVARNREWRRAGGLAAAALAVLLVATLPGPFAEEQQNLEPELYFGAAYRQISIGRVQDARPLIEAGLRLDPNNANAHTNLGSVLLLGGQAEEARPHFERALALKPGVASGHDNLGMALAKLSRHAEAADQFRAALQAGLTDARVRCRLAQALASLGRWDEARAEFEQAVAAEPRAAHVRLAYGRALRKQGQIAAALAQFQAALDSNPRHPEALQELAATRRLPAPG